VCGWGRRRRRAGTPRPGGSFGAAHHREQVIADPFAQERDVVVIVDLVADDVYPYVELPRVAEVLPVDADAARGGFADQERGVEAGEQPGGERVSTGGHVHHHVFTRAVHDVVALRG
jgi:hypothetical protein